MLRKRETRSERPASPERMRRAAAATHIGCSQHSLYKVLISAVGAHGDEGGPEKAGQRCVVLDRKHAGDFFASRALLDPNPVVKKSEMPKAAATFARFRSSRRG